MNFYNAIHLADDVETMKIPLTEYSAFSFENLLGLIKKLIGTPRNPLAQIVRRKSELNSSSDFITKIVEISDCVESVQKTASQIDYVQMKVKSIHICVNYYPNNLIQLKSDDFVKI